MKNEKEPTVVVEKEIDGHMYKFTYSLQRDDELVYFLCNVETNREQMSPRDVNSVCDYIKSRNGDKLTLEQICATGKGKIDLLFVM